MITSNCLQKKKYPLSGDKQMSPGSSFSFKDKTSLQPSRLSQLNNLNSEPLKTISHDLSFKGSSVKTPEVLTITQALTRFTKEFGQSASDHLKATIDRVVSKAEQTGVKRVGDKLEFKKQSNWDKVKDIVLYPFVKMPVDLAMGFLEVMKKIPGLKKSKTLDKMLNADIFKKRREEEKLASETAAIQTFFEQANSEDFKAFKNAHSRIKSTVSNYSSTAERCVTRFVTGMIPAFFLANDAYNLSMYMKNNKTDAKAEKKRRFNQETARIVATTALTFGILSLFSKKTNASGGVTNFLMAAAAFVSEFVGRIAVGTPVLPIGKNAAQKYSEKRSQDKKQDNKVDAKKTSANSNFKGGEEKTKSHAAPPENGILTFANVAKVVGGLLVFGFAVDKIKNTKAVSAKLEEWGKKYNSHFKEDNLISRKDYKELTDKLRNNGFGAVADKYDKIIADQTGDKIKLGSNTRKFRDVTVNKVLLFPVDFAWNTLLMGPYKLVKNIVGAFKKEDKNAVKTVEELAKEAKEKKDKDIALLKDSVGFLRKIKDEPEGKFKEKMNSSLLGGLDNVTKSNYSNADAAAMIRATMQAVTSAFLIADSYNMVMIESRGEDKNLAEQKAKERTLQRFSRIMYGSFCVQLVNGIFRKQYDSSLLAAQVINTGNTFLTESLERTSVGLPLTESNREKIIDNEQRNLRATGLKGAYFRTMAKLTGKKALSERAAKAEEKKA